MTHDSAIKIMTKLLPLIEKSGAERVLSDYAAEQDLPVAQLEKLAQVYNTMAVISHVDNAAPSARGNSIPLVDVPNLVVGYAAGLDREKAARGPRSTTSHDAAFVDLNAAILKELQPAPRVKAASTHTPEPAVSLTSEDLESAVLDNLCELRHEMSKLAGDILKRTTDADKMCDIEEVEKEALYLESAESVKMAGDFLTKFAGAHRVKVGRFQYDTGVAKRAFQVTPTPVVEQFARLAKCASLHELFEKVAAGDVDATDALLNAAKNGPEAMPDVLKAQMAALLEEAKNSTPSADGAAAKKSGPLDTSTDKKDTFGSSGYEKAEKPEAGRADGKGWIGSALSAPFRWASKGIQTTHEKGKEMLATSTSERQNTAQRKTDISVEDIRRSINLRRMIGTDPVLKEADPKAVLDIYNAVTALNPEIAGNMPALRLLLREAVSYEGLTLDAQKTLVDIYKSRNEGEGKEADNTKRRYSIGRPALVPKSK